MSRFEEFRNSFETRVRQSLRWSPEEFQPKQGVDPKKVERANRMYRIVLLAQVALVIVYFSMLLSAVVYQVGGYAIGALAFASSPVWVVILLYGVLSLGVLRALVGVVSTIKSSRCGSYVAMLLSFVVLVVSFVLLIFGILRAGGTGIIAQEVSPTTFADGKE